MQTVRTTIRIRKDLLDQSKMIALKKGTSLQEIINDTLAVGFKHVSNLNEPVEAMRRINALRERIAKEKGPIDLKKLLARSKRDQR